MPGADTVSDDQNRNLFVFNGGFLTGKRIRRILELSGWSVKFGKPGAGDWVGVWGKSPTSPRGETVAEHTDSPILRVEDGFLRSVRPGRAGDPPLGLCLDQTGVHFDSSGPSDLETLLATHPLDDTALLNRARLAAQRIKKAHLSKYNAFDTDAPLPDAPYVLVIDQTRNDASIRYGGATEATFAEMLVCAQVEHPGNRIVIKSHPDTMAGNREGHFADDVQNERITLWRDPVSPWALMEGATAVYTVSSQLGFEAIFAGHKPRVFGQPFYAGWGLTQDEYPVARRMRNLTRAQIFAGAMILYPKWYDPHMDRLCPLETAIDSLDAQARAWRDDHTGYIAHGMSRWKHPHLKRFFGQSGGIDFAANTARTQPTTAKTMVWGTSPAPPNQQGPLIRIEDGFLRSSGLGAELTPPLSLVADDLGLYYDPTGPSRLEHLINGCANLDQDELNRAHELIRVLRKTGLSKYNLKRAPLDNLPEGTRILVPGQVEDDQSVVLGCQDIRTNRDLLCAARQQNPDAVIVYKPHPDVEAGLRTGRIPAGEMRKLADVVFENTDAITAINACQSVWTMTSTLGFEALIRGKPVTCLGMPFYAGWGLTHDVPTPPTRRISRPSLAALVHACLIQYPRYLDPVTGLPCPPEVIIERLQSGIPAPNASNRILSVLQRWSRYFRG